jgi:CDP-4-dehydro-6-deoxyglucose reductase, E1
MRALLPVMNPLVAGLDSILSRAKFAWTLNAAPPGNRTLLLGSNLVRQPALVPLPRNNPAVFRVAGDRKCAERIMNEAIPVGVDPGLTRAMMDSII